MKILDRFRKERVVTGEPVLGEEAVREALENRSFKFVKGFGIMGDLVGKYYRWSFRENGRIRFDLDWTIPGIERVTTAPMFDKFQAFSDSANKDVRWAPKRDGVELVNKGERELCRVYRDGPVIRVITSENRVLET